MLKKISGSIFLLMTVPVTALFAQVTAPSCESLQKSIVLIQAGIQQGGDLAKLDPSLNTADLQAALASMNLALTQEQNQLQAQGCAPAPAYTPVPTTPASSSTCDQTKAEIKVLNAFLAGLNLVLGNPPPGSTPNDIHHNAAAKAQVVQKLKAEKGVLKNNHCQ